MQNSSAIRLVHFKRNINLLFYISFSFIDLAAMNQVNNALIQMTAPKLFEKALACHNEPKTAFRLFHLTLEKFDPDYEDPKIVAQAHRFIGELYLYGEKYGIIFSKEKAQEHFIIATNQKDCIISATYSLYYLGRILLESSTTDDLLRGMAMIEHVANQNAVTDAKASALYFLALLYMHNINVPSQSALRYYLGVMKQEVKENSAHNYLDTIINHPEIQPSSKTEAQFAKACLYKRTGDNENALNYFELVLASDTMPLLKENAEQEVKKLKKKCCSSARDLFAAAYKLAFKFYRS